MRPFDDSKLLARMVVLGLLAAGLAVLSTSCEEAFSGPSVQSATIEPARIPQNDAGMTDECFTVEMSVSGFEAPISEVTIFIVEEDSRRVTATEGSTQCKPDASPKFQSEGSQVTVEGIKKTLVNQLDPGEYGIGTTIVDEEGSEVTQRDITTLEIVEQ